jgi:hypothetical protein
MARYKRRSSDINLGALGGRVLKISSLIVWIQLLGKVADTIDGTGVHKMGLTMRYTILFERDMSCY